MVLPGVDTPAGSAPASSSGAENSAAPATTAPAPSASTTGVPSGQSATSGEPPRERWNDILGNARTKARAEAEAEFKQRYSKYDSFEQDPWAAVQSWLSEAGKHSIYGPMVKQWAGQHLKSYEEPNHVAAEPKPNVPIVDANGNVTGYTYDDKTLREWQRWNEQQLNARWEERLSPLEQREAQRQQREEIQEVRHTATVNAHSTLTTLRQQPYFKEHEPAIRQALLEHEEWGDNVHAAYNHVLVTQILPTLSRAEQQQVVDQLTGKGAGSTVPAGGTAHGVPKFKSFKDAAKYYEAHPAEAAVMANR